MTYELALKLKNAGFPQERGREPLPNCYWNFNSAFPEQGWYLDNENLAYEKEYTIYIPTLSELIEACGEDFYALWVRGDNTWFACKDMGDIGAEGSTPEEAVAKLWLAINKK